MEADMMTFEQFRDTAQWSDDLTNHVPDAPSFDGFKPQGNLYLDMLYIENVLPHWHAEARKLGNWSLVIGNHEKISDDLESLERDLYHFACGEGYCDEAA